MNATRGSRIPQKKSCSLRPGRSSRVNHWVVAGGIHGDYLEPISWRTYLSDSMPIFLRYFSTLKPPPIRLRHGGASVHRPRPRLFLSPTSAHPRRWGILHTSVLWATLQNFQPFSHQFSPFQQFFFSPSWFCWEASTVFPASCFFCRQRLDPSSPPPFLFRNLVWKALTWLDAFLRMEVSKRPCSSRFPSSAIINSVILRKLVQNIVIAIHPLNLHTIQLQLEWPRDRIRN